MNDTNEEQAAKIADLCNTISMLVAKVDQMQKALKPFADCVEHLHPLHDPEAETLDGIKVREWWAAHAALHSKMADTKPTGFYSEAQEDTSFSSVEELLAAIDSFDGFYEPTVIEIETFYAGPKIYAAVVPLEDGGYTSTEHDSHQAAFDAIGLLESE
jgi:hypothetical protein